MDGHTLALLSDCEGPGACGCPSEIIVTAATLVGACGCPSEMVLTRGEALTMIAAAAAATTNDCIGFWCRESRNKLDRPKKC